MSEKNPRKSENSMENQSTTDVSTAEQVNAPSTSGSVSGGCSLQSMAINEAMNESVLKVFQTIFGDGAPGKVNVCTVTLKRNLRDLRRRDKVNKQLKAMKWVAEMLRTGTQASVDIIIQHGVIPLCVNLLRNTENQDLLQEAAAALHYIADGNHKQAKQVVNAGAVDLLIDIMQKSANVHTRRAAASVLVPIVGAETSPQNFDIYKTVVPVVVDLVQCSTPSPFLGVFVSNLVVVCESYIPLFPQKAIQLCIPVLTNLLTMTTDRDSNSIVCMALKQICTTSVEFLEMIAEQAINSGAVPRLVELLDCRHSSVFTPCSCVVTYFVGISELWTRHFIDCGILPKLVNLLGSSDSDVVWHATRTVRNIAGTCAFQMSEIIRAGIVPLLVKVLNTGKLDAQKEAVLAFKYIASETEDHINHLLESESIPAICNMLKCEKDTTVVVATLDTVLTILKTAKKFGHFDNVAFALDKCGGSEFIEKMQNQDNDDIYKRSFEIIDKYFCD